MDSNQRYLSPYYLPRSQRLPRLSKIVGARNCGQPNPGSGTQMVFLANPSQTARKQPILNIKSLLQKDCRIQSSKAVIIIDVVIVCDRCVEPPGGVVLHRPEQRAIFIRAVPGPTISG